MTDTESKQDIDETLEDVVESLEASQNKIDYLVEEAREIREEERYEDLTMLHSAIEKRMDSINWARVRAKDAQKKYYGDFYDN